MDGTSDKRQTVKTTSWRKTAQLVGAQTNFMEACIHLIQIIHGALLSGYATMRNATIQKTTFLN